MNSITLSYDRKKMDSNILKEFAKDKAVIYEGSQSIDLTDLYGNQYNLHAVPASIDSNIQPGNYENVGKEIAKLTDVICAAEYFFRGILPNDTRRELEKLSEFICKLNVKSIFYDDTDGIEMTIGTNGYLSLSKNIMDIFLMHRNLSAVYVESSMIITMLAIRECFKNARWFNLMYLYDFELLPQSLHLTVQCNQNILVVYEDGDLDSAIDTIISAYSKSTPYVSLKHIFVQESIERTIVNKLTERLNSYEWNLPNGYKCLETLRELKKQIVDRSKGTEHVKMNGGFYSDDISEYFKPLIVMNKSDESTDLRIVNFLTFRTTKELISLIGSKSPFGLSVWCNNSSITNELVYSADYDTIWINCYDQLNMNNLTVRKPFNGVFFLLETTSESDKSAGAAVDKSIKLFNSWKDSPSDKKIEVILKAIKNIKESKSYDNSDQLVEILKRNGRIQPSEMQRTSIQNKNMLCSVINFPTGPVVIRNEIKSLSLLTDLLMTIISYDNAVLLTLSKNDQATNYCNMLADCGFPIVIIEEERCSQFYFKYNALENFWHAKDEKESLILTEFDSGYQLKYKASELGEDFKFYICKCKSVYSPFGETFSN